MAKSEASNGLVLDDYLNVVAEVWRDFNLPQARLTMRQIEAQPTAKPAADAVLKAFADRCGASIYSKVHPLLGARFAHIYGEVIKTEVYSGHRIRHDRVDWALRRTLELGLQTIVQLPSRQKRPTPAAKRLKSLVSALTRSAGKLTSTIYDPEIRGRIDLYEDATARAKLSALPSEIRQSAEMLKAVAKLKVRKVRVNSPNPQISFAMYFIGWIEAGTGRQHYQELETLMQSAFHAAGKSVPPWTDRLAIERHLHKQRRRKWARSISA
jgi:hypothetical protein